MMTTVFEPGGAGIAPEGSCGTGRGGQMSSVGVFSKIAPYEIVEDEPTPPVT